jgi:hypothetical protein
MLEFIPSNTTTAPSQVGKTPRQRARLAAAWVVGGLKPSITEAATACQVPILLVEREIAKIRAANSANMVISVIDMLCLLWDAVTETERDGFARCRQDSLWQSFERITTAISPPAKATPFFYRLVSINGIKAEGSEKHGY